MPNGSAARLIRTGRVSTVTMSDVIVTPLELGSQFLGKLG